MNRFFPLSSRYDENWVRKNSLGENVLYNLESLCDVLEIENGMRILDLGSGKAVSAIFLAKEYNAKVWAVDSKMCPTANFKRIAEMGCEDLVQPLKLDARRLPFPMEYFDLILAVDSFMYYGTDFEFTNYISQFLKPGGQIGIVDMCLNKESITKENLDFIHSLDWWYDLWNNSGMLKVTVAEIVPENDLIKKEYIKDYKFSNKPDLLAEELANDNENVLKIFRMVARRISREIYYQ